jgi:transmembrane sensor
MTRTTENNPSSAIRAEAAQWFARLHTPACSEETRQEFAQWINVNTQHELAYEQCRTLWLISGSLKSDATLKRELAGAYERIEELRADTSGKSPKVKSPVWQRYAQAAAVFMVGLVFVFTMGQTKPQEYITHVGEQRLVQLADGSTVMLNTNTKIQVSYNNQKRRIDLIQGEAYFDVSKDPKRPFEVIADNSLVRAVGTEFNVALLNRAVDVDVAEGIVEFEIPTATPTAGKSSSTKVAAKLKVGEAAQYQRGDNNVKTRNANLARVSAWQVRKIYFDANTLEEAVAEYNRYTQQKISVVDSDLNQQRITGIFHVGDLDAFIFSLEQGLNARVVRKGESILVMKQ